VLLGPGAATLETTLTIGPFLILTIRTSAASQSGTGVSYRHTFHVWDGEGPGEALIASSKVPALSVVARWQFGLINRITSLRLSLGRAWKVADPCMGILWFKKTSPSGSRPRAWHPNDNPQRFLEPLAPPGNRQKDRDARLVPSSATAQHAGSDCSHRIPGGNVRSKSCQVQSAAPRSLIRQSQKKPG